MLIRIVLVTVLAVSTAQADTIYVDADAPNDREGWTQRYEVTVPQGGQDFGESVAVNNRWLLVGGSGPSNFNLGVAHVYSRQTGEHTVSRPGISDAS